jgi:SAM-dependent methyltransferase
MPTYDATYYADRTHSRRSAATVLPHLLQLIGKPESAVDIGCGSGDWLSVLAAHGCRDLHGVEGDWARAAHADIQAPITFHYTNLDQAMPHLGRRFDLALSLEVAEHLPERQAPRLVEALTGLSDVVLFSAAVPGQQGVHHVNEQWQSYWAKLFIERGFVAFDAIRPRIAGNQDVDFWYRQNVLLYARAPGLAAGASAVETSDAVAALDHVSPDLYLRYLRKDIRRREPFGRKLARKFGLAGARG